MRNFDILQEALSKARTVIDTANFPMVRHYAEKIPENGITQDPMVGLYLPVLISNKLSQPKKIKPEKRVFFQKSATYFSSVEEKLINSTLEKLVDHYWPSFLIGIISQGIRDNEASVARYPRYLKLVDLFHQIPREIELSDVLILVWREKLKGIEELESWIHDRATAEYHQIVPFLEIVLDTDSPNEILTIFRHNFKTEKEIFILLSDCIQGNPLLHHLLTKYASDNDVEPQKLFSQLKAVMLQLCRQSTSEEIRHLGKIFINLYLSNDST